ncbi:MAG: HAMP domain-containing sensor histidine kinase [Myxococcota bacterium]
MTASLRIQQRERALDAFWAMGPERIVSVGARLSSAEARAWWRSVVAGELASDVEGLQGLSEVVQACETMLDTHGQGPQRALLGEALHARVSQLTQQLLEHQAEQKRGHAHLLNVVSHDLRSSMVTVQGYMELILQETLGPVTSEQRSGLTVALRGVSTVNERLGVLLDFIRLEQGRLAISPSRIELGAVLERVAKRFRAKAERKGLRFVVAWPQPLHVWMDAERIGRVVGLLLDNAVRHTDKGHIALEVVVAGDEERITTIVVRDTGPGIDPALLEHVREPFVHGGTSTAGVGLTLAEALIQAHGGTMLIASGPEHGCTVTLQLPAGKGIAA